MLPPVTVVIRAITVWSFWSSASSTPVIVIEPDRLPAGIWREVLETI